MPRVRTTGRWRAGAASTRRTSGACSPVGERSSPRTYRSRSRPSSCCTPERRYPRSAVSLSPAGRKARHARQPVPTGGRKARVAAMTRNVRLAVVRGDGIGTEVVEEGLKVLDAALGADVTVSTTEMDLGARRWHATGETLTAEDLATIRRHDAILLGAVGDPGVPSGVLERGLLLRLRFELDHYVNLRPGKLYPGVRSPLKHTRGNGRIPD